MESATPQLIDRRIAEWLFLLTFAVYAWFYAGAGWNQNALFDTTRAMVERHTFTIDAYASNTGDVGRYAGHIYANKAPGLSWLAAVPYALLYAFERDPGDPVSIGINAYLCTLVVVAAIAALIPALLYSFARKRGVSPLWAATVALTIAFATQVMPYSTMFMVHAPSGALMLLALTTERRALAGVAAALAASMNYLCAPLVVLIVLVRGWRALAAAVPPLVALALFQKVCFGGYFRTSIATMDERFVDRGALLGILGRPSLEAFAGITISPYRGLFFYAPVLLLAIAGAVLWFRSRRDRPELAIVAAMTLVFFGFNVSFNGWEAGFGIGARYLVPLIPLFGLAMLHCRGFLRPLLVTLAAVSFAINFTATAVDPLPSASIPSPLTQYLVPLLLHGRFSPDVPITAPWSAATFTGHTSVNRLAHDEAVVFTRHRPGSPASEWSSFNLGETFAGAGDPRSLIPPLLLLAGGAAAILRRARRASAA
jgi:hypothetical protein